MKTYVSLYLDKSTLNALKALAKQNHRSISNMGSVLIEEGIKTRNAARVKKSQT